MLVARRCSYRPADEHVARGEGRCVEALRHEVPVARTSVLTDMPANPPGVAMAPRCTCSGPRRRRACTAWRPAAAPRLPAAPTTCAAVWRACGQDPKQIRTPTTIRLRVEGAQASHSTRPHISIIAIIVATRLSQCASVDASAATASSPIGRDGRDYSHVAKQGESPGDGTGRDDEVQATFTILSAWHVGIAQLTLDIPPRDAVPTLLEHLLPSL